MGCQHDLVNVWLAYDCLEKPNSVARFGVLGQLFWINCKAIAPATQRNLTHSHYMYENYIL